VISEGPALIEALPGGLQNALNGALLAGEELLIAVRGNIREAFAATDGRLLVLKEPAISGTGPVEVREAPLASISNVRASPRPVGGRLTWESSAPGAPTSIEYPTYDGSKYGLVAQRLQQMIGQNKTSPTSAPATGPAGIPVAASRPCPKCQTSMPMGGCWCPNCGLQVSDPCWECGKPLAEDANFCAYCGTPNSEPAVIQCPQCKAVVGQGQGYCSACGGQARPVCQSCEQPMRRDWTYCPACGGEPAGADAGATASVVSARVEQPLDSGLELRGVTRAREADQFNTAGIQAYEREEYGEAVRLFRDATAAAPNNASYWTNLGVAYGESGDETQAFTAYRRAVELNPRELQAYLNMGYLYNERERTSEAREMWEKVVQISPDSDEAKEARDNLRSLGSV
jgi:RNA polymerase subunit RPABC4/transcription elongation factor Spt4